jgi:hypothetical protein
MKKICFFLFLLFAINVCSYCQNGASVYDKPPLISFKLKNNSLLPATITVISYRPDQAGNGTNGFLLIPYASKSFKFPIGTKIYIANSQQVNMMMGGATIAHQAPFLLVKAEDAGKSFKIK